MGRDTLSVIVLSLRLNCRYGYGGPAEVVLASQAEEEWVDYCWNWLDISNRINQIKKTENLCYPHHKLL